MIIVGLTGGIGSGKSTVSAGLVKRGAILIDADAITRELQEPGMAVFEAMVERFGRGILRDDGGLDRPAVAAIVFADEQALKDLNSIVHPKVREVMAGRIEQNAGSDGVIILDVPLLAEGRKRDGKPPYDMQAVLVVDCPVEVAVERLVTYRGFDEDDARRRVAKQADRADRVAMADFVIDNSGAIEDLDAQLAAAWTWLSGLEATRKASR